MISDLVHGEGIFDSPAMRIKMAILHAVDRPLDRITISELCQKAGISRQTFYRHFQSKYDIPWWYSIFCRQFYLDEIGRTIDWRTGYYHHLRLITREREFFRHALQPGRGESPGQGVLTQHRRETLLRTLEQYRLVAMNDNLRFLVDTYSKLESDVMLGWLRSDDSTDLVTWTDNVVSLVPNRLYVLLRVEEPGAFV